MDCSNSLLFFLSCLCLFYLLHLYFSNQRKLSKLPPGPTPLPIIGNIFQIADLPHRSLAKLSKIYGPLMTLKLGSVTSVIVSSSDMAREILQKHDLAFSSRPVLDAARAVDHHKYSVIWSPVPSQWRKLRKIIATHLFTKNRLDATQILRQKKVKDLLEYVEECSRNGQAVDIGGAAFTTSLNLLSNTFFSIDLAGFSSESSQEFRQLACAVMEVVGKLSLADLFPILGYFDPLGVRRTAATYTRKFLAVFDNIITHRLSADPSSLSTKDDVLTALLSMSKEDGSDLSLDDIRHMLRDLFVAGTDTTSVTIEWAMAELLRNPEKMAKAQSELDQVLGKDGVVRVQVQESDIERLPYLQAVVKESLRLHPSGPLLLPHKNENDDVEVCGYVFPKNTQVTFNVWAIGRDPKIWENPEVFLPERFLESKIDFRGKDFELIPFGAGRRMCPGVPLANRMVHLELSNLLYSFNWKAVAGDDGDMTEKQSLSLHKAKPLLAVPVAR